MIVETIDGAGYVPKQQNRYKVNALWLRKHKERKEKHQLWISFLLLPYTECVWRHRQRVLNAGKIQHKKFLFSSSFSSCSLIISSQFSKTVHLKALYILHCTSSLQKDKSWTLHNKTRAKFKMSFITIHFGGRMWLTFSKLFFQF